jgi:hypothetical protein
MTTSLADWKGVPAPSAHIARRPLHPPGKTRPGTPWRRSVQRPCKAPAPTRNLWDYLPYGPFPERSAFNDWLNNHAANSDPYFFSVIDRVSEPRAGPSQPDVDRPGPGPHRDRPRHLRRADAALAEKHRGGVPAGQGVVRASATAAWNGSATTATPAPSTPPNVWASASKACSASTWWSRVRTATPRGTRFWTRNGRRLRRGSSSGCPMRTRRGIGAGERRWPSAVPDGL